ncbi:Holliday junction branch migration protein RuvA [Myxosarcina sp. GI1]|uniref:Holliday junction branch migration protein RuvA n=1 Tax=Myxosarcina sp. GI1 TaxID=1541065 RepID=UPI0005646C2D|nr:Holliday junction branch migration protein RuvA [Myxosarcina sp. GI1]
MISYLKGINTEIVKTINNRHILILEVNDIGYEIQVPSRLVQQLSTENSATVQIFTYLQIQEDKQILYGFATAAERDLFRQLVGVSGIGMQLGIAAIDTLGISDLVGAIVSGNISTLTKIPGVGNKTAERIALELKTKLSQWRKLAGVAIDQPASSSLPKPEILEDLEMTLLALGYSNEEIESAINAISQNDLLLKNPNVEEWIRSAIAWLGE